MWKAAGRARLSVAVALGMSVTVALAGPNPPPTKASIQSWVFDGAFQASSLYGVAHTETGLVSFLNNGVLCTNGESNPTGFRSLSPAQSGVYLAAEPLSFPLELSPSFIPQALAPPIDPALVDNDCVALQHEAAVQTYIAGLEAQIDAHVLQTEMCVQNARQLACDVFGLVPTAMARCGDPSTSELCPPTQFFFVDEPGLTESVDVSPPASAGGCFKCSEALSEQRRVLDDAARGLAACQKEAGELVSWRNGLVAFLNDSQGLPPKAFGLPNDVGSLSELARSAVDKAEDGSNSVDAAVDAFAELAGACSHESLVESCEECLGEPGSPPPPPPPPGLPPTGIVKAQQSARHLGRLATAFRSESRRATDAALRDRYARLAARLRGIPKPRVLDVTAPGGVPFSQSFVALRRADLPDDGRSPLAVVLTFVRSRRCPPPLNRTDRLLLDESFEAFRKTLDPGRVCPTCPPPR